MKFLGKKTFHLSIFRNNIIFIYICLIMRQLKSCSCHYFICLLSAWHISLFPLYILSSLYFWLDFLYFIFIGFYFSSTFNSHSIVSNVEYILFHTQNMRLRRLVKHLKCWQNHFLSSMVVHGIDVHASLYIIILIYSLLH